MKNDSKIIVVYGGTGYYGRKVVEKLINKGQSVRVVSRNYDSAMKIVGDKVEILQGDVTNREIIIKSLQNVECIIICLSAANNKLFRKMKQIERDAVLAIMEEAEKTNISRFIYMSGYEIRGGLLQELKIPEFGAIKIEIESKIVHSNFNWTIFENYAQKYDKECYVQGTIGECDFIEQELKHNKNVRILDVGCGTGRHSIELTKRGYIVTGVDLSENQIKRAREKAEEAGVTIDFQIQDARNLSFDKECSFDLLTFRDHNTTVIEDDSGNKRELKSNERYYVPSEIKWLLKTLGYKRIDIFGAKLGAYSRNDKLTTDDFEMLVVAEK